MKRSTLAFELEDFTWFPPSLRDAETTLMRSTIEFFRMAVGLTDLVSGVLDETGETQIVDLCTGAGGPTVTVSRLLRERGRDVSVALTDLYPSEAAIARLARERPDLTYEPEPVDAISLAPNRPGLRTLFNAFHHLPPATATRVLASAVSANRPIVVAEFMNNRMLNFFEMLFVPFLVLLAVPFQRPLRLKWWLFTYLIPLIPLCLTWDGLMSTLRLYSKAELESMSRAADPDGRFKWRIEKFRVFGPFRGQALVGTPATPGHED